MLVFGVRGRKWNLEYSGGVGLREERGSFFFYIIREGSYFVGLRL